MPFFKNISIRYKLLSVYIFVSVIVFSLSFILLYSHVNTYLELNVKSELSQSNKAVKDLIEIAATITVKNHLKTIAYQNKKAVSLLYKRFQNNEMSETQAKAAAIRILLSQKVGKTGYIYCLDSHGVVVVHPDKKIQWQTLYHKNFIQKQLEKKDGYIDYDWSATDDSPPEKKALYMTYFEPWDWIISASSYTSEFNGLVRIDDFKHHIAGFTFGETGYSFLFDMQGNNLIHPEMTGNIFTTKDPARMSVMNKMIKQKNGILSYKWKGSNDADYREKFAVFHHMPDFNWIIASSSFKDEVFAPLSKIRLMFFLILMASLLLIALVTILVSRSITKPLYVLIKQFEKGVKDNFSSPLKIIEDRNDEIGKLSVSFTQFMERLSANQKALLLEIQTRKEAESQLSLFEKVFENVGEGISVTDEKGTIEAVNQAFTTITGYESHEVIGENPRVLKSDHHDDSFYKEMWQSISENGAWSGEIWNRRKNGEAYPELLSISAISEKEKGVKKYVAVFRDISEMKTKEEQIEKLAYHDPLTLLPNRALLKDRLKQAIAEAKRTNEMILILFIDLDHFKTVNDSMGHPMGDELLKEMGRRMLSVVRSSDTVSRVGGDEFNIIIPHINKTSEMGVMVERVQSIFENPFLLGEQSFHVTGSIGVSIFPTDGKDPDNLIKHADLAMYQSKQTGRNRYSLFEPQMAKIVSNRVKLESDLHDAIDNEEFQVFFQPRVDSHSCKPLGMEALVRWIKKDNTVVPPGDFIPIAEESGLIVPLGEIVFRAAIIHAKEIRKKTGLDLVVSINVSIRQFEDPGFESMVSSLIEKNNFPKNRIEIEVTETLLISDSDNNVIPILNALSDMGVQTAIDDFGTGYSSLAYIQKLPITTLKIDKIFIDELDENPENCALVETIILMAKKLNLSIVAEGVETLEQLRILRGLGHMEIQGYLFSRPLPVSEFEIWLTNKEYNIGATTHQSDG